MRERRKQKAANIRSHTCVFQADLSARQQRGKMQSGKETREVRGKHEQPMRSRTERENPARREHKSLGPRPRQVATERKWSLKG